MRLAAPLAALLLSACAATGTVQQTAPPVPIVCNGAADCQAKWSRAVSWVATHSSYKIQTQTDSLIQTMGPLPEDPRPAYTVTKLSREPDSYEITFAGGCDNFIGCVPTIADARAEFRQAVIGP